MVVRAMVREYGTNIKIISNSFFDILKKLKIGIENYAETPAFTRFLGTIGFQTIHLRN